MATKQELEDLKEQLRPLVEAAIARGEDLSSEDDMMRFIERVLEERGYVRRGDHYIQPSN